MVPKLIKNGKVAVILSTGYGSGFSSWANSAEMAEKLMFDPEIAQMIIDRKDMEDILSFAIKKYPEDHVSELIYQLSITWVDVGTKFVIKEYDGVETIVYEKDLRFYEA